MKSKSGVILKELISASAITTFGFPPYFSSLASISPKVLETESLPGRHRGGPTSNWVVLWPLFSQALTY